MIPTVFIVGAPRCGTSSLSAYLDAHPQVFMSKPKEPHYFGSDLEIRQRPFTSLEAYLKLFEGTGDVRHAGEASVHYLYSRAAPGEILALSPDARIIVMVRDPFDVIPSLHAHNRLLMYEDIPDLGQALDAEEDRRQGRRIPPTCIPPLALQYRALVSYAVHLVRYQEAFGRDRVLSILFEDLRDDPEKVYDRCLAFLGLEAGPRPEFKVHNAGLRWRHEGAARILLSTYRRARDLGNRLPPRLLRMSFTRMGSALFLSAVKRGLVPAKPAWLPHERRRELREQLRPDVERLQAILGRDLSTWLKVEA